MIPLVSYLNVAAGVVSLLIALHLVLSSSARREQIYFLFTFVFIGLHFILLGAPIITQNAAIIKIVFDGAMFCMYLGGASWAGAVEVLFIKKNWDKIAVAGIALLGVISTLLESLYAKTPVRLPAGLLVFWSIDYPRWLAYIDSIAAGALILGSALFFLHGYRTSMDRSTQTKSALIFAGLIVLFVAAMFGYVWAAAPQVWSIAGEGVFAFIALVILSFGVENDFYDTHNIHH